MPRTHEAQDALFRAVESGDPIAVEAAVRAGASLNERGLSGETALTYAVNSELAPEACASLVRTLLALGAQVKAEGTGGPLGTSVHKASRFGYVEALSLLLRADGAAALSKFNDLGHDPLISAVVENKEACVLVLLDAGSPVDGRDESSNSHAALGYAVQSRNATMTELLLRHGANPSAPGWMGLTPIQLAMPDGCDDADTCEKIRAMLRRAQEGRGQ